MEYLKLCDSDYRFMTIVWDNAPVSSGALVKLYYFSKHIHHNSFPCHESLQNMQTR